MNYTDMLLGSLLWRHFILSGFPRRESRLIGKKFTFRVTSTETEAR